MTTILDANERERVDAADDAKEHHIGFTIAELTVIACAIDAHQKTVDGIVEYRGGTRFHAQVMDKIRAHCDGLNTERGQGGPMRIMIECPSPTVDRDGAVVVNQWGDWYLAWWRNDLTQKDFVLTYAPEDYWITCDRIHEHDWEEHIGHKVWGSAARLGGMREAFDYCREMFPLKKRRT